VFEVDGKEASEEIYEDEPKIDNDIMCLDWYDSDVTLKINKQTMMIGEPFHRGAWSYVWSGVRATYGCTTGKVFYEIKILDTMNTKDEEYNDIRVGWSTNNTSLLLGKDESSFAYCGKSGKKSQSGVLDDYGEQYGKGDVIGVFLEFTEEKFILKFSKNGKSQGVAVEQSKSRLGSLPLYPHICTRNFQFEVNFGNTVVSENDGKIKSPKYSIKSGEKKKDPWFSNETEDFDFVANTEGNKNMQGIEKREDCDVMMMIGLPASGKTAWATKYVSDNSSKRVNVIGLTALMDRMEVNNSPIRKHLGDKGFERLIPSLYDCLKMWIKLASRRHRNILIDQTNVYPITKDKGKVHEFRGMNRKAVVLVPSDEDYLVRIETQKKTGESQKDRYVSSEDAIMEMKAVFKLPEDIGETSPFTEILYVGLEKEEAASVLEKYREEAKIKGYPKRDNKFSQRRKNTDNRRKRGHIEGRKHERFPGRFPRGRGFDFGNMNRMNQGNRMFANGMSPFHQGYPSNMMNNRFFNQSMYNLGAATFNQGGGSGGYETELNRFAFQNRMAGASRPWNNIDDATNNNPANIMRSMNSIRDQKPDLSQISGMNSHNFQRESGQGSNGTGRGFGFMQNNNPWSLYDNNNYNNFSSKW
jgi:heterogeneous nuclear ribonucleoprotein U-like protein 1